MLTSTASSGEPGCEVVPGRLDGAVRYDSRHEQARDAVHYQQLLLLGHVEDLADHAREVVHLLVVLGLEEPTEGLSQVQQSLQVGTAAAGVALLLRSDDALATTKQLDLQSPTAPSNHYNN